jgi:hypothetical protein
MTNKHDKRKYKQNKMEVQVGGGNKKMLCLTTANSEKESII